MGVQVREFRIGTCKVSITPAEVAAGVVARQNFTVPGLRTSDTIFSVGLDYGKTQTVNIGVVDAYPIVSASKTVASVGFVNPTAGALTPVAGIYAFNWFRPDGGTDQVDP